MAYNTISLKGLGQFVELPAAAAITPGQLIEVTSANKLQRHATEGDFAQRLFAVEDSLQGRTISTNYTANELESALIPVSGDEIYVVLAAGSNYPVGAALISAGDGNLKLASAAGSGVTVSDVIGYVMAAVDLSASGAVATHARVRIR